MGYALSCQVLYNMKYVCVNGELGVGCVGSVSLGVVLGIRAFVARGEKEGMLEEKGGYWHHGCSSGLIPGIP